MCVYYLSPQRTANSLWNEWLPPLMWARRQGERAQAVVKGHVLMKSTKVQTLSAVTLAICMLQQTAQMMQGLLV